MLQPVRTMAHVFAALLLGGTMAMAADGSRNVRFDIPAQSMESALLSFSQQAGVQLVVANDTIKGLKSPPLQGEYSTNEALSLLLKGSGLSYRVTDEKTIAIGGTPKNSAAVRAQDNGIRLVEVAAAEEKNEVQTGSSASQDSGNGAQTRGIPEVLVRGSRSLNTDIERTEDDAQPYVVFKAEEIERSMAGTLDDFLKTRLPMNTVSTPSYQDRAYGNLSGNISRVSLRGLGPTQTLILVNGRRLAGVSTGSDIGQPDLNGIPLSSVERIEVLPSTAGGIYGGGATGGVVNIILKNDFSGLDLTARYDNTFDTDSAQRRVDGNAGFSFEGGRTRILLTASHADANNLMVRDRDFLSRAYGLQFENNPSSIIGGTTPPVGATANIRSVDGQDLVLKAGNQSLGFPIAHVPYGYAGFIAAADGGQAFLAGAGSYNLDLPKGQTGERKSLAASPEMNSASLSVSREFSSRIEAFADASYNKNDTYAERSSLGDQTVTLQPNVSTNPFTRAIRVRFAPSDFEYGSAIRNRLETLKAGAGLTVKLPASWMMRGGYDWSRSRTESAYTSTGLTTAGRTALSNGQLDPLRDVDAFPNDYSAFYFTPSPNSYSVKPREVLLESANLMVAGPVLRLPGGPLALSAQVERREAEMQAAIGASAILPDTLRYTYMPARGQNTDSYYAELTAPLFSSANALRAVKGLELQASYRYDRTTTRAVLDSTFSTINLPAADGPFPDVPYVTNAVRGNQYTFGLRYQPSGAVTLRTSYGAGILPPSLNQLVPFIQFNANPAFLGGGALTDPKRKNDPLPTLQRYVAAGNPDLRPEQSRSWSAGTVLTPPRLPGLRLSVDFTRIAKTDEISSLLLQEMLRLQDNYPGRVTRAELTAQDRAAGYEFGLIQILDNSFVNIADSDITAYDVQGDYVWTTAHGTFTANVLFTYSAGLERQLLANLERTDLVGYSDGPLKWRGNGGLTWERAGWVAGWNAQYYHSYFVYFSDASDDEAALAALNQGSRTVPRQVYHDVFARYRFDGAGALANTEIQFGVRNLFDKSPPILATPSTSQDSGISGYGDVFMRRYSVSVRKSFR